MRCAVVRALNIFRPSGSGGSLSLCTIWCGASSRVAAAHVFSPIPLCNVLDRRGARHARSMAPYRHKLLRWQTHALRASNCSMFHFHCRVRTSSSTGRAGRCLPRTLLRRNAALHAADDLNWLARPFLRAAYKACIRATLPPSAHLFCLPRNTYLFASCLVCCLTAHAHHLPTRHLLRAPSRGSYSTRA